MRRIAAIAPLALMAASPTAADEAANLPARKPHFEAWLGGSWTDPLLDTAYATRYSPSIVNAEEILLDETLSKITSELDLQPLDLDLSSSRLLLSLVFRR